MNRRKISEQSLNKSPEVSCCEEITAGNDLDDEIREVSEMYDRLLKRDVNRCEQSADDV